MSVETKSYPPGTLLRITETHQIEGGEVQRAGTEFTVQMFVSAEEADEPIAYYWGETKYGSSVSPDANKVELVKTADRLAARRIPSAEQIIRELHCLGDYDGFRIDEADAPEGGAREIVGMTDDGLPFAFTITVSNIHHCDL